MRRGAQVPSLTATPGLVVDIWCRVEMGRSHEVVLPFRVEGESLHKSFNPKVHSAFRGRLGIPAARSIYGSGQNFPREQWVAAADDLRIALSVSILHKA